MRFLHTTAAMAVVLSVAHGAALADQTTDRPANPEAAAGQALQMHDQTAAGQGQASQTTAGGSSASNQPVPAYGASENEQWTRRFGPVDQNNDGTISAEEARAHREQTFSQLDRNQDGTLSRDEVGGHMSIQPGYAVISRIVPVAVVEAEPGFSQQAFQDMDADQNRQLSRQEYMGQGEKTFNQKGQVWPITPEDYQRMSTGRAAIAFDVDRDGDGQISQDEAAAHWERTFEELDRNADDRLSDQEWARAREEREQIDRQFSALDPNGDGKVTKDEFLNVGDQKYQSADVNADDKVSTWEYRGIRRM